MGLKIDCKSETKKVIRYNEMKYGDLAWYDTGTGTEKILIMKVFGGFISLLNPSDTWISNAWFSNGGSTGGHIFEPVTEVMTFVYDPWEKKVEEKNDE